MRGGGVPIVVVSPGLGPITHRRINDSYCMILVSTFSTTESMERVWLFSAHCSPCSSSSPPMLSSCCFWSWPITLGGTLPGSAALILAISPRVSWWSGGQPNLYRLSSLDQVWWSHSTVILPLEKVSLWWGIAPLFLSSWGKWILLCFS